jgi:hypothetical protein
MATRVARRFGGEVEKSKMKGNRHIPPHGYVALLGEMTYLEQYLSHRLLPQEPEDRKMANLLLILQNLVEYELEQVIEVFVQKYPTKRHMNFLNEIQTGFVAIKTKFNEEPWEIIPMGYAKKWAGAPDPSEGVASAVSSHHVVGFLRSNSEIRPVSSASTYNTLVP